MESANKAEEEAIAKLETDVEEEVKTKAEEKANAKAESAARAEEEAKARAEAASKAEENANAKAESAARAEEEAKARAEAASKAEEEANARGKSQEIVDDEAKIIAASEAYAKAIAIAEDEARNRTGENSQEFDDESIIDTETSGILPTLDFSNLQTEDTDEYESKDTGNDKTSVKIKSRTEEMVQEEEGPYDETISQDEAFFKDEIDESEIQSIRQKVQRRIRRQQKPINLSLIISFLIVIIVSGALLLPYVLPTNQYITTIEKIATDSIGEPVKIGSLSVSFLPIPNLDASNITIGSTIKIKSAILTFSMFSSFDSNDLSEMELIGVNILPNAYDRIIEWTKTSSAPSLNSLKQIQLKNAKLEYKNIAIPLINGNINLVNGNKFSKALFATRDNKIKINVIPKGNEFTLNISAKEWKPLHSSSMILSNFDAKVIAGKGSFLINELDSRIYDGVLRGAASAKWSNGWTVRGKFETERVNFRKAAESFNTAIPVEGNLTSTIEIASIAPVFEQLFDALQINGEFNLQNGSIKIDLGNSIRSKSKGEIAGGQTKFNALSGTIERTNKTYQLKQLKLSSGMLSAEGNLDIGEGKKLSGEVVSNLKGIHTMSSGPVSFEGTIKNPVLTRHYTLY